jgi:2-dehydro-3-deoxyphosphooctonate aldolase (KDO 8-P synthase)
MGPHNDRFQSDIRFPVPIGNGQRLVVIGGINVLESLELALAVGAAFHEACAALGLGYVFKASFDKANRSSVHSYRGPGLELGLRWLEQLKRELCVPVLTDVHEPWQVPVAAEVCDVLQLPAFLARQSDLVAALAVSGRPIHIKKPQFLSPQQMGPLVDKFVQLGCRDLVLCERGSCFGYDNQVVDLLGLGVMRQVSGDRPISVDLTHSLQCREPGAAQSSGRRQQMLPLAKAVVASGIAAVFVEAHPDPDQACCDGPSALPSALIKPVLEQLSAIDQLVKAQPALRIG